MPVYLKCKVQGCDAELVNGMVVTSCMHILCNQCAITHGFGNEPPWSCPVCRKHLEEEEICNHQDWESSVQDAVQLMYGLSPTMIMEAASSAMAFWSQQLEVQISKDGREKAELSRTCAGWKAKYDAIQREEETISRQCEDLNRDLEKRNKELLHFRSVYDKLKKKCRELQEQLYQMRAEEGTSQREQVSSGRLRPRDLPQAGHGVRDTRLPRAAFSGADRINRPRYVTVAPDQQAQTVQRSMPVPESYSHQRPPENLIQPQVFNTTASPTYMSVPRAEQRTNRYAPGSGRAHHATLPPQSNVPGGPRHVVNAPLASMSTRSTSMANAGELQLALGRKRVQPNTTFMSSRAAERPTSRYDTLTRPGQYFDILRGRDHRAPF